LVLLTFEELERELSNEYIKTKTYSLNELYRLIYRKVFNTTHDGVTFYKVLLPIVLYKIYQVTFDQAIM
jgi:hypothetical protein